MGSRTATARGPRPARSPAPSASACSPTSSATSRASPPCSTACRRSRAATRAPRAHVPVDVGDLADAALADARRRHPGASFEIAGGDLATTGDESGLRSALDNLLENAARHGARTVRLTIEPDRVLVDDDGPGIPPEERHRVFERFARGTATTAAGSGLGLAIVAQQAELHGGEARIEDSPLGGARLILELKRT